MFGQMKAVEAEAISSAIESQPLVKQFGQICVRASDMIEKPNLHVTHPCRPTIAQASNAWLRGDFF